jgi:drug/metabolite transporter (DMT)-like permease
MTAKRLDPRAVVVAGVFFVSFSAILVRLSEAPPLIIATYRLGFTSLMLFPVFLRKTMNERGWLNGRILLLCVVGGICLALHFYTWFYALRLTSVASAAVLVNTHPIFIVIGSTLFLKERIHKKSLPFIALTFIGSVVIALGDYGYGRHNLQGDLLALAGAFFVSVYMLVGRVVRKELSLPIYAFSVYGISTLVLLLLDFATGTALLPYSAKEFLIFFLLALVCTIGGHTVFNWALRYVRPSFISTAVLGEPVFASLFALILFRETPSLYTAAGALLVIAGIFFFVRITESDA